MVKGRRWRKDRAVSTEQQKIQASLRQARLVQGSAKKRTLSDDDSPSPFTFSSHFSNSLEAYD